MKKASANSTNKATSSLYAIAENYIENVISFVGEQQISIKKLVDKVLYYKSKITTETKLADWCTNNRIAADEVESLKVIFGEHWKQAQRVIKQKPMLIESPVANVPNPKPMLIESPVANVPNPNYVGSNVIDAVVDEKTDRKRKRKEGNFDFSKRKGFVQLKNEQKLEAILDMEKEVPEDTKTLSSGAQNFYFRTIQSVLKREAYELSKTLQWSKEI